MNKYLEKALWTILFDKSIDNDDLFKYTNPITMEDVKLSYNGLVNGKFTYADSYIGLMIAHPKNILKINQEV